jgi:hypothetical protein
VSEFKSPVPPSENHRNACTFDVLNKGALSEG